MPVPVTLPQALDTSRAASSVCVCVCVCVRACVRACVRVCVLKLASLKLAIYKSQICCRVCVPGLHMCDISRSPLTPFISLLLRSERNSQRRVAKCIVTRKGRDEANNQHSHTPPPPHPHTHPSFCPSQRTKQSENSRS